MTAANRDPSQPRGQPERADRDGPGALLLRYGGLAAASPVRARRRAARRAGVSGVPAHTAHTGDTGYTGDTAVAGATGAAGVALPDRVLTRRLTPEAGHVDRYCRVCGFDVTDTLPPTYPHVLAFGDTLRLFADQRFPFPAVGLIHIRLEIDQLRPLGRAEPLTLRSRFGVVTSHRRGPQFDVHIEARDDAGAVAWRSASRYLHPERPRDGAGIDGESGREPGREPGADAATPGRMESGGRMRAAPSARWRLGGEVGRRYAAVSGDPNPVHLHPATALIAGRRRPIAHGMWLAARCLAALTERLPDTYRAEVDFRRPVRLPAELGFAACPAGEEPGWDSQHWDFQLADLRAPGSPRVTGRVRGRVPGA